MKQLLTMGLLGLLVCSVFVSALVPVPVDPKETPKTPKVDNDSPKKADPKDASPAPAPKKFTPTPSDPKKIDPTKVTPIDPTPDTGDGNNGKGNGGGGCGKSCRERRDARDLNKTNEKCYNENAGTMLIQVITGNHLSVVKRLSNMFVYEPQFNMCATRLWSELRPKVAAIEPTPIWYTGARYN